MIANSLAKKEFLREKTFKIGLDSDSKSWLRNYSKVGVFSFEGRFHHVSQVGLECVINKQAMYANQDVLDKQQNPCIIRAAILVDIFIERSAYYTQVNMVLIFKSILCLALLQQLIFPSCYVTFSGSFFRVHSIRVHVLYHPSLFNVL